MQQLVLGLIFLGLGVCLYHSGQKANRRFKKAKTNGILFSEQAAPKSYHMLQKGQLALTVLMAIYLLVSYFVPLSQTPILILLLLFLGTYYAMHYCSNVDWFFDKAGLWTSHLSGYIGFENIVGYEWREYKTGLILRVKYKGRGIMLMTSDLVVKEDKKKAVTDLLNKYMAGI